MKTPLAWNPRCASLSWAPFLAVGKRLDWEREVQRRPCGALTQTCGILRLGVSKVLVGTVFQNSDPSAACGDLGRKFSGRTVDRCVCRPEPEWVECPLFM